MKSYLTLETLVEEAEEAKYGLKATKKLSEYNDFIIGSNFETKMKKKFL